VPGARASREERSRVVKLSDAHRLARLLAVLRYLCTVDRATVGELASEFGGSARSLHDDLVAAWLAEDPEHVGLYPFHLHLEYFAEDDPEALPIADRSVWLIDRPELVYPPGSDLEGEEDLRQEARRGVGSE